MALILTNTFLNFIFLKFLAVLGLCCCVGFPLVPASGGYCLVVFHELFIVVIALAAGLGL